MRAGCLLRLVLFLFALVALAVPAWLVLSPHYVALRPARLVALVESLSRNHAPPPAPPRIDDADLARLEAMAVKACTCARTHRGADWEAACWGEFDRTAARYSPVAYQQCLTEDRGLCFGEVGGHPADCIALNRTRSGACSAEERMREPAPPAPNC